MGEPAELGADERRDTLRVARAIIDKSSGDRARPMTALVIEAERLAGGSPEAWAIDTMVLRLAQEVVRLAAIASAVEDFAHLYKAAEDAGTDNTDWRSNVGYAARALLEETNRG
jgi:hypothetical protein